MPVAPISAPNALAPPRRMRSAKIGISTVYGIPVKPTTASSMSSAWIAGLWTTQPNPSTIFGSGDPWRASAGRGGSNTIATIT
jgi:hypothetical protein